MQLKRDRFHAMLAWIGAQVGFNGWEESVIVQVSRPVVGVVVARLVTQAVTAVGVPVTVLAGGGVPGRLAS